MKQRGLVSKITKMVTTYRRRDKKKMQRGVVGGKGFRLVYQLPAIRFTSSKLSTRDTRIYIHNFKIL